MSKIFKATGEMIMIKNLERNSFNDGLLIKIHLGYIIASFVIAAIFPFYIGVLLIFTHWLHERMTGDCVLTVMQRESGYAEENEDFFHYLYRRKDIDISTRFTHNIHNMIKTVILFIVLYKLYIFLKNRKSEYRSR